MDDEKFREGLAALRRDWGTLAPDPNRPGVLLATNEPMTGLLVGARAPIIAEIINRALAAEQ